MKKIILFALILLSTIAHSQKLDCRKFKNIRFSAEAFPQEYVIRKDSIQESYMNGKVQTVWSVKWLDNCKYEAVCIKDFGSEYVEVGDRSVSEFTDIYNGNCFTIAIRYYNHEYPDGIDFSRGFCTQKE